MPNGEAFDVNFVDDRAMPRCARRAIRAPSERRVNHHSFEHAGATVAAILGKVFVAVTDTIRKKGVMPLQGALNLLGVRIEEKLVVIEP